MEGSEDEPMKAIDFFDQLEIYPGVYILQPDAAVLILHRI